MSDKHNKLLSVRHKLQRVAEFLVDYLPLANAHNSDFFVHKHWEGFVHRSVGEELLALSPEELSALPSRRCAQDTASSSPVSSTQGHDISPIILKPKKKLMCCKFHRQKSRQLKPKWDMSLRPNWRHDSLDEFVAAAHQHSLANMQHILGDAQQLRTHFAASSLTPDKVSVKSGQLTVTNFMSSKKGYEVDEMAQMCAAIMHHYALNKVIDIGSGRGYLGCQLALMHGLQVLGIDYSTTNTNSAKIRAERLEKHWEGLVRNAQEDAQRGYKVKRGKNYRGKIRRRQRSQTESTEPQKKTSTSESPVEVEVNLSNMFRENSLSPTSSSPPSEDELRKESEPSKSADSLVIYLSEPRVRRPRPDYVTRFSPAKETATLYRPITHYVTVDTDLQGLVKTHFGDEASDFLLTGLHTCGNLASSVLQLYIANPAVRVLCNVGCCYHLLEEEFVRNPYLEDGEPDYEEVGFPLSHHLRQQGCQLGRNARMLASQATDRAAAFTKVPGQSLFWRAVLQVILRDVSGGECRQDWQVGKLAAKCTDFTQYVYKAMDKLNMQHQLTPEKIAAYESEYRGCWGQLQAFVQLRAVLAPCIETLLLLDRLYYLLEQECIEDAHLVRLFDPVKSPRCYGIIAVKRAHAPATSISSAATASTSTRTRSGITEQAQPQHS